jgi:hypothetical protein
MGEQFPKEKVTHPSRYPSKRPIHQENLIMKRIQSILFASLLTVTLASNAVAGNIYGVARDGNIYGVARDGNIYGIAHSIVAAIGAVL